MFGIQFANCNQRSAIESIERRDHVTAFAFTGFSARCGDMGTFVAPFLSLMDVVGSLGCSLSV